MFVFTSLITGLLIALMVQVNGLLRGAAGELPALVLIHAAGLAASGAYLLAKTLLRRRGFFPSHRARKSGPEHISGPARKSPAVTLRRFPYWGAAAGVLGIGVVFLNNEVFARGGVLLTLAGTLTGQTLSASLLELTAFFRDRRAPALQRIVSPLLIVPGTVLIALRSGIPPLWIFLALTPGILLMIQSVMNAKLSLLLDTPRMLILNYGSATAALFIIVMATGGITAAFAPIPWETIPSYLVFGGGLLGAAVIGVSSFLFARTSAVKVVLGLYIGQIGLGVILDLIAGRGLSVEKVVGIVLLLLGLVSGRVRFRRR